jgi:hypothetical protein
MSEEYKGEDERVVLDGKQIADLIEAQDKASSEQVTEEIDGISETEEAILLVRDLLNKFKKAQADYQNMKDMVLGWGDKVPQDDILLESKKKYAEELERQFLTMINKAFESLRDEIKENGVVESETARYEPDDIIRKTQVIENGLKGGLTPEIKYITRSNGYRDKIEKIVNLFLEYKNLSK